MHFIAMLACEMDLEVSYDMLITMGSALVGIASCMLGLGIVGLGVFSWRRLMAAGVCMGGGVAGMHYMGMAAMIMPADAYYDAFLVIASVVIAIVASIAALWLAFHLRGGLQMVGSALVMGVAVCGMHYTGMAAVTFVGNDSQLDQAGASGAYLGIGIFVVTTVLLIVVLTTSVIRQNRRRRVQI
jgi:NO-binding membrane sensor protein with MHYT domain